MIISVPVDSARFLQCSDNNRYFHSPPQHLISDNDTFDFGDAHSSKPKDNNKKKNKRRNKNKHKNNKFNNGLGSKEAAGSSHSYTGVSMPSYTHEITLSDSNKKEVYYPPPAGSNSASGSSFQPHAALHFESKPFRYPASDDDELTGHASTTQEHQHVYNINWSPTASPSSSYNMGEVGSSAGDSSSYTLPATYHGTTTLSEAESNLSPVGPIFRPPPLRKGPPPGHRKGHKAPRAGPRALRNSQNEAPFPKFGGGGGSTTLFPALFNRPVGGHSYSSSAAASSPYTARSDKPLLLHSIPKAVTGDNHYTGKKGGLTAAASTNIETAMMGA